MTVNTCLSFVDILLPNAVPTEVKKRWLLELEGRLRVELLGEGADLQAEVIALSDEEALSAPFPYDQIYWMYLVALIEYESGDYARYENGAAIFNAAYRNYAKYRIRVGKGG